MTSSIRIELENIQKSFGERKVLNGVSAHFESGKSNILTGKNGSGKTTLLNILSGNDNDFEGHLRFNQQEIDERNNLFYAEEKICYIPQDPIVFDDLTCLENILLPYSKKEKERAKKLLAFVGLEKNMNQKAFSLSLGEKQRLAIARALYGDKPVLLLDEITSALDTLNAKIVWNLVKEIAKDHLVLVVTHEKLPSILAEHANIYRLENGKITLVSSGKEEASLKEPLFSGDSVQKNPSFFERLRKNFKTLYRPFLLNTVITFFLCLFILLCGTISFSFNPENETEITFQNYLSSAPGFLLDNDQKEMELDQGSLFGLEDDHIWRIGSTEGVGHSLAGIFSPIHGYQNNSYISLVRGNYPKELGDVLISSLAFQVLQENGKKEEEIFQANTVLEGRTVIGVYQAKTFDHQEIYLKTDNALGYFSYSFMAETVLGYPSKETYGTFMALSTENNKNVLEKTDILSSLLVFATSSVDSSSFNFIPVNIDSQGNFPYRLLTAHESFSIFEWCFFGLALVFSLVFASGFYQGNKRLFLYLRLTGQKRKEQVRYTLLNQFLGTLTGLLLGLVFFFVVDSIIQAILSNIVLYSGATYIRLTWVPFFLTGSFVLFEMFIFLFMLLFFLSPRLLHHRMKDLKRK